MEREEMIEKAKHYIANIEIGLEFYENWDKYAEGLVNELIPEGSVVLTKEEYIEYLTYQALDPMVDGWTIKREWERILKEEVKKVLQKANKKMTEKVFEGADEKEMVGRYCLTCLFNKGGKCTRIVPCYIKQPELVIASAILETGPDAEVE